MRKKAKPTAERVRELFHYDPETGIFTRRKPSNSGPRGRKYGKVGAGRVSELGYVLLMIDGVNHIAGSVAWLYEHGEWPSARIKYINGNPLDNRLTNIRIQDEPREKIKAQSLTHERLKELLHYEPLTGWFTWRVTSSVAKPGERAGGGHGHGYRSIGLDYKKYLEHILAWFYMKGEWPSDEVDHRNLNKSDNSWDNLRLATRSQNGHNKGLNYRNKTGVSGVNKHGNKYRVKFLLDGRLFDLGSFSSLEEAAEVRFSAEREYLGEFASSGKKLWSTPTLTDITHTDEGRALLASHGGPS